MPLAAVLPHNNIRLRNSLLPKSSQDRVFDGDIEMSRKEEHHLLEDDRS